ncbi:Crp/Fnr family transcriptional regulator [Chryseoglobus sp. 28M-23]|uniref:Crp/Fnr family transcriptional regulator n=1 Tax=Chryseoglobus sp. 28M-23 TaxID=2772253 RepID=UPI001746E46E|nr:Crp/Fnr family transcriptional regulator [Chryseoglobus sp. 28M-23]MBU1251539.1 Crp/Fnr family transcriptional regulator [Actinomycetota bacterium]MBU1608420.1 Crp/Fnr family transcriptional regulator [Actinomycetota bacterium]MBU2316458.1 Crp/Fnr family transcriptional regulator [Actinomycetota bacterium]MBU2385408.1 Crp/Fnr family transcriptional regulator [Actinomycetota bacterium]QOD92956.1 Crp/Fnr family transcriptional regulator [Chryseoglobus sp. 28M-23]
MPDSWKSGFDAIVARERASARGRPDTAGSLDSDALTHTFSCLSDVDLFADLSTQEAAELDRMAPAQRVLRGELVFSQSQPSSSLFILKSGRIRVFRVTEDGKAMTMGILEPGAVFGEMVLVGQRMHDNYAEAIEDSQICRLEVRDVERFLLSDPRIAVRIARLLGEQVARLEERLTDLAHRPLPARIARTIATLADGSSSRSFPGQRGIRITHEQLAGLVGATRESTSKVMAELAAQRIIRQARGRVLVVDRDALAALSRRIG